MLGVVGTGTGAEVAFPRRRFGVVSSRKEHGKVKERKLERARRVVSGNEAEGKWLRM